MLVSDDRLHHPSLDMAIVVPGTSTMRHLPLHVVADPDRANGLSEPTAFQVEELRAVSTSRCHERLGRLDAVARHTIDEVLRSVLRLS